MVAVGIECAEIAVQETTELSSDPLHSSEDSYSEKNSKEIVHESPYVISGETYFVDPTFNADSDSNEDFDPSIFGMEANCFLIFFLFYKILEEGSILAVI